GDAGPEREALADRLAEHADVGHDPLRLESPEVRAEPGEADLDLVRDADPAGGAHVRVGLGEIAGRKDDLASDARQALGEEGGERAAAGADLVDDPADGRRVLPARL